MYPVVIINWVQYLGPPVPLSFPDYYLLLVVVYVVVDFVEIPPFEELLH